MLWDHSHLTAEGSARVAQSIGPLIMQLNTNEAAPQTAEV